MKLGVKAVIITPTPTEHQDRAAERYAQKKITAPTPTNKAEAKAYGEQWTVYYSRWFRKRGFQVAYKRKFVTIDEKELGWTG